MDDITFGVVANAVAGAPVFPAHVKAPTYSWNGPTEKKPDIDSWSSVFELCWLVPSAASHNCKTYVDRMRDSYASGEGGEKAWVANSFMGAAVNRLDEILKTATNKGFDDTNFVEFFVFAAEVLLEHNLLKPKIDPDVDVLIIATKRSNMSALQAK